MNAQTSLIPLVEANPAMVLVDAEKFDRFYEEVAREVRAHVPDLATATGRKAIASLAFKVARTKTAIDEAGKVLKADALETITKIDTSRKAIRDRLDALRDEARKPLDDWQEAEDARLEQCKATTDAIRRDAVVTLKDTSDTVAGRLDLVRAVEITEAKFGEMFAIATGLRQSAIETLEAAALRLVREEGERAELARFRAAEEERQAREAEEREAAEAKMAEEARQAEEARRVVEAEEAAARRAAEEGERLAAAAKAAQEAATAQAERAAEEARLAQQCQHEEALAAERRRADEAEAARKAEAERAAREDAERAAQAKREADAQAAREADVAHKSQVMGAAKDAIIALGVVEAKAKSIVMAIKAGEVPAVSIRF